MKYQITINGKARTIDDVKFNAHAGAIADAYPDATILVSGGKSMSMNDFVRNRGRYSPQGVAGTVQAPVQRKVRIAPILPSYGIDTSTDAFGNKRNAGPTKISGKDLYGDIKENIAQRGYENVKKAQDEMVRKVADDPGAIEKYLDSKVERENEKASDRTTQRLEQIGSYGIPSSIANSVMKRASVIEEKDPSVIARNVIDSVTDDPVVAQFIQTSMSGANDDKSRKARAERAGQLVAQRIAQSAQKKWTTVPKSDLEYGIYNAINSSIIGNLMNAGANSIARPIEGGYSGNMLDDNALNDYGEKKASWGTKLASQIGGFMLDSPIFGASMTGGNSIVSGATRIFMGRAAEGVGKEVSKAAAKAALNSTLGRKMLSNAIGMGIGGSIYGTISEGSRQVRTGQIDLPELGHGAVREFLTFSSIGWINPLTGNMLGKISSPTGKVATKAASFLGESTLFPVVGWIDRARNGENIDYVDDWVNSAAFLGTMKGMSHIGSPRSIVRNIADTYGRGVKPDNVLTENDRIQLREAGYTKINDYFNDISRRISEKDGVSVDNGLITFNKNPLINEKEVSDVLSSDRISQETKSKVASLMFGKALGMRPIVEYTRDGNDFKAYDEKGGLVIYRRAEKDPDKYEDSMRMATVKSKLDIINETDMHAAYDNAMYIVADQQGIDAESLAKRMEDPGDHISDMVTNVARKIFDENRTIRNIASENELADIFNSRKSMSAIQFAKVADTQRKIDEAYSALTRKDVQDTEGRDVMPTEETETPNVEDGAIEETEPKPQRVRPVLEDVSQYDKSMFDILSETHSDGNIYRVMLDNGEYGYVKKGDGTKAIDRTGEEWDIPSDAERTPVQAEEFMRQASGARELLYGEDGKLITKPEQKNDIAEEYSNGIKQEDKGSASMVEPAQSDTSERMEGIEKPQPRGSSEDVRTSDKPQGTIREGRESEDGRGLEEKPAEAREAERDTEQPKDDVSKEDTSDQPTLFRDNTSDVKYSDIESRDRAYKDAVEKGDIETAQRLLSEEIEIKGYNTIIDYAKEDISKYKDYARAKQRLDIISSNFVSDLHIPFKEKVKKFNEVKKYLYSQFPEIEKHIEEQKEKRRIYTEKMEAWRKTEQEKEVAYEKEKLEEEKKQMVYSIMSSKELDDAYMKAVDTNDTEVMRRIINEVALRKGYLDSEYQGAGTWKAPGNGYETTEERRSAVGNDSPDLNIDDMANGYTNQPIDIFINPQKYGQSSPEHIESAKVIKDAIDAIKRGEKAKVKVYRAVPKDIKEESIRNGDWVTPSKAYAELHGNSRLKGKYRIIEQEVQPDHLWWDSNDLNEWGYDDGKNYSYKNTKNNRKFDDLITRDDKGNVIPPSKRFNSDIADTRFSEKTSDVKDSVLNHIDISDTVQSMSEKYGTSVKIVRSKDEITNQEALDAVESGRNIKGWYEPKTGDVVIYEPNATSIDDVTATYLHEVVGHKGMRGIIGEDNYGRYCDAVYKSMSEADRKIFGKSDRRKSADEYIASLAERGTSLNAWRRLVGMTRDFLRKYIDLDVCEADVEYMIWRSAKHLSGEDNTALFAVRDRVMRSIADNAREVYSAVRASIAPQPEDIMKEATQEQNDMINQSSNPVKTTALFRIPLSASEKRTEALHNATGKRKLNTKAYDKLFNRDYELYRLATELIRDKIIDPSRNFYNAWNQKNSIASSRVEKFKSGIDSDFLQAYNNLVHRMGGKNHQDEINFYTTVRTALERQRKIADRERQKTDDYREKDYAGITYLVKELCERKGIELPQTYDSGKGYAMDMSLALQVLGESPIDALEKYAVDFEERYSPEKLWDSIHKVTDFNLENQLDGGLISEDAYQLLRYGVKFKDIVTDMEKYAELTVAERNNIDYLIEKGIIPKGDYNRYYEYYLPLKGDDGVTMEDYYDYEQNGTTGIGTVHSVKGHTNKARMPLQILRSDASRTIANAEKNKVLQEIFVTLGANPSRDRWSTSSMYLVPDNDGYRIWRNDGTDIIPPVIKRDSVTGAEIRTNVPDTKDAIAMGSTNVIKDANFEHSSNRLLHRVGLKINGSTKEIWFADKRIADILNENFSDKKVMNNNVMKLWSSLQHGYGSLMTSFSPEFAINNTFKDKRSGFKYIATKYGLGNGVIEYNKNWYAAHAAINRHFWLTRKIQNILTLGRLSEASKYDQYLKEYMEEGGATAVNQLGSRIPEMENFIRDARGATKTGRLWEGLKKFLTSISEYSELQGRLAVYATSRGLGVDKRTAMQDSKEATANFDQRGEWNSVIGSFDLFFNAKMQGVRRTWELYKAAEKTGDEKKKQRLRLAAVLGEQVLESLLRKAVYGMAMAWYYDDKDYQNMDFIDRFKYGLYTYENISSELRTRNLMYFIPGTGMIGRISLPPEEIALNRIGEYLSDVVMPSGMQRDLWYQGRFRDTMLDALADMGAEYGDTSIGNIIDNYHLWDDYRRPWFSNLTILNSQLTKPIVETIDNKDFTNRKFYNDNPYSNSLYSYEKSYYQVSDLANRISEASGDKINAYWLDHLVKGYAPGVLQIPVDVVSSIIGWSELDKDSPDYEKDKSRAIHNTPVLRMFIHSKSVNGVNKGNDRDLFYSVRKMFKYGLQNSHKKSRADKSREELELEHLLKVYDANMKASRNIPKDEKLYRKRADEYIGVFLDKAEKYYKEGKIKLD